MGIYTHMVLRDGWRHDWRKLLKLKPPDGLEIRASAPPPNHHLEKKRSR
jgi:hypothetical protein